MLAFKYLLLVLNIASAFAMLNIDKGIALVNAVAVIFLAISISIHTDVDSND